MGKSRFRLQERFCINFRLNFDANFDRFGVILGGFFSSKGGLNRYRFSDRFWRRFLEPFLFFGAPRGPFSIFSGGLGRPVGNLGASLGGAGIFVRGPFCAPKK